MCDCFYPGATVVYDKRFEFSTFFTNRIIKKLNIGMYEMERTIEKKVSLLNKRIKNLASTD